jgi:hypothetical protein
VAFEVVKSELVYQGQAFDIRREQLQAPDGRLYWVDIVSHPQAVTMIPIDPDGMIWFVRQYRHPGGKFLLERWRKEKHRRSAHSGRFVRRLE